MRYADMPQRFMLLGRFTRQDREVFEVEAVLYETPPTMDYWRAVYTAKHEKWGDMRLQLYIPKRIAVTSDLAAALVKGAPLDQVQSELVSTGPGGRDLNWVVSNDGWQLVG